MPGITLVGLGPGDPAALSQAARDALANGQVFLRTRHHPVVIQQAAPAGRPAFEDLLDSDTPLATVIERWIDTLLDAARTDAVVYAVPGNPLVGDATVRVLLQRAEEAAVPVNTIPASTVVDAATAALPPSALALGVQVLDTLDLALAAEHAPFGGGEAALSPLQPLLLTNPGPARVMAAACETLARLYPDSTTLLVLNHTPTGELHSVETALGSLADATGDMLAIYLAPVSPLESARHAAGLQRIVARLRAPGGCPWDREQTHQSLMRAGIEEAYEVLEAIERDDAAALREELGDLLLQVYLHAQIAEEAGEFTLEDVIGDLSAKLVRRHPHVFGEAHAADASDVLQRWDEIKRAERAERGVDEEAHPLGQIPAALPALMRAQTVLRRAIRAGLLPFDPDILQSRWRALAAGEEPVSAETLGDALLATALLAAEAGLDAEQALRERTLALEAAIRGHTAATPDDLY